MKAAVLHETNTPIRIDDVTLDNPDAGEVIVRTMAAGVCHSDLHLVEGLITMPLPCLLGHESAGVVEKVAPGLRTSSPATMSLVVFQCSAASAKGVYPVVPTSA